MREEFARGLIVSVGRGGKGRVASVCVCVSVDITEVS